MGSNYKLIQEMMNECPNASLWYQLWLYLSKFEGDIVLPDQFALAYYIFGMKKETLLETQPQSDDVVDAAVVSVKKALDTLKERKEARKDRNAHSTAPLKKHQTQNQFRPLQALGEKERYSYHEVDVSATTKSAIPKKPRPYPSRPRLMNHPERSQNRPRAIVSPRVYTPSPHGSLELLHLRTPSAGTCHRLVAISRV